MAKDFNYMNMYTVCDYVFVFIFSYRNNPMFATVSLRPSKTNDRSAPKI